VGGLLGDEVEDREAGGIIVVPKVMSDRAVVAVVDA
jgi:hypothetical protein